MGGETPHPTQKDIGYVVAGFIADLLGKTILEGIIPYVHLVIAKHPPEPDLVFSPDQLDGIGNRSKR